jgi:hypothetical protein
MSSKLQKISYILFTAIVLVPKKTFARTWISCSEPPNCTFVDFWATFNLILKNILQLGIMISVVIFVIAGWTYLTSGGDSSKVKKGHKMLTNATIGFVIMLSAFLIVDLILRSLGVDSLPVKLI